MDIFYNERLDIIIKDIEALWMGLQQYVICVPSFFIICQQP